MNKALGISEERLQQYSVKLSMTAHLGNIMDKDCESNYSDSIHGDVKWEDPETEEDVEQVGAIDLLSVDISSAEEAGLSHTLLLDRFTADEAVYLSMFRHVHHDCNKDLKPRIQRLISENYVSTLLIVRNISLDEKHRGFGLGLVVLHEVLRRFEDTDTLTLMIPDQNNGKTVRAKLARYYQRLGFVSFGDGIVGRHGAFEHPGLQLF